MARTAPAVAAPDRIRVEELARRADVSVDTIRFYQKRQLLPPPRREGRIAWYGAEHVERLARIRELQREGFSLALIRRLLDGELDAADAPLAAAVAGAQRGETELLDRSTSSPRASASRRRCSTRSCARASSSPQRRDGVDRLHVERRRGAARRAPPARGRLPAPRPARARDAGTTTRRARSRTTRSSCSTSTCASPLRDEPLTDAEQADGSSTRSARCCRPSPRSSSHHFRTRLLEVAQEHLEAVGDTDELAATHATRARAGTARVR